ncbi:OFA family MFS transporter [Candidatus Altiarchaeota archaeon]
MSDKVFNRWIVVVGALIIQMCLGVLYSWSVFLKPLMALFEWSKTDASIAYSLSLATFAVVMVFAGFWQDKKGPRLVASVGGVVMGLGFLLASKTTSLTWLYLSYGVLGGAGVGLAYVCPIAACVKWFPDKRGLISGLAVAGFGAGSLVFAPLAAKLIVSVGVLSTFFYLGVIFIIAVVLGAQLLRNPPEGYVPEGWSPPTGKDGKKSVCDHSWREMLKTRQFYLMWLMFCFAALAGLMVIGHLAAFGKESGLDAETAAAAVGVLAIFNGAGRIVWGAISDKIGRTRTLLSMYLINGLIMLLLIKMGGSFITLAAASAVIGFCFGGNFSMFPSLTADYFGTKHVGINYGWVFTSYGIGGLAGPILGARVYDATQSYEMAFITAGVLCFIAAGMSFLTKPPKE